ncbi:nuclear transport factor 2 family protein [Nocardia sp. NPDC050406]|uniref:nuclear transport factor 2 family protein n=1 Tax=Nocardia sp. NPDC050406 TaxID=3364318 RepID=UPI00379B5D93
MSDSDLDLIAQVYRAFDTRDLTLVERLFAPDIQIRQTTELPWGGHYRGRPGAVEFLTKLLAHVDSKVLHERTFQAGDRVVQIGRSVGNTLAGNAFDVPEVHVWQVRDGLVVGFEAYVDTPALRAALGDPR